MELENAPSSAQTRRLRIVVVNPGNPRVSPDAYDLSGDIALKPGELRIEFYGAEDLAAKLFELSQAMANDWQAFARAVEEESRPGRVRCADESRAACPVL